MAKEVVDGAMCVCSFGLAPYRFDTTPRPALEDGLPMGTVMDFQEEDIKTQGPFVRCISPCNPNFLFKKIPAQCQPLFNRPWVPGSPQVMIDGKPPLGDNSILICMRYY